MSGLARDAFLPNHPGHGEIGDADNPWWAVTARNVRAETILFDGEDLATLLDEHAQRMDDIEAVAVVVGAPFQW